MCNKLLYSRFSMDMWPKIILLGDSITQYSFNPNGWGASVNDFCQRKCDIFNRGYSGYTTKNIVKLLPSIMNDHLIKNIVAVTIFFGANDSVLPEFESAQYVSLSDYETNLVHIINHFKTRGEIDADQIILITPPPVDEEAYVKSNILKGRGDDQDRKNENTVRYAEICLKVAIQEKCRHVDLFHSLVDKDLSLYLCDGLHLSEGGNIFLANCLKPHILELTSNLPENLPHWTNLD